MPILKAERTSRKNETGNRKIESGEGYTFLCGLETPELEYFVQEDSSSKMHMKTNKSG